MTMFNGKMEQLMCALSESWDDDKRFFRSALHISLAPDESIILSANVNGQRKEFLRASHQEWESAVRKPTQCARHGSTLGNRFFVWHWLEEQNKLKPYINLIKEMRNA